MEKEVIAVGSFPLCLKSYLITCVFFLEFDYRTHISHPRDRCIVPSLIFIERKIGAFVFKNIFEMIVENLEESIV